MFASENEKGPQPENSFPVTIDVVSLYTNIPHEDGIRSFEKYLDTRQNPTVATWYLILLLKLVLKGNLFEFNGQYYRQQIGTAMGSKCAPTLACLFMQDLEENTLLPQWGGTPPHLWKRFIDDVLFFWRGSEQELKLFIDHLNSKHPYIQFEATYDIQNRTVPFLDMTVTIGQDGFITTDLYRKETDVVQYLLPNSCHPSHITKNIPFSLGYRLLRLCSKPELLEKALEDLKKALLSRNYNPKIIFDAFQRVRSIPREEALKRVDRKKDNDRVPLVITYHPSLPSISQIASKHWKVMTEDSPKLKRIFAAPPVVAYKRSKNLRDHLVRAKITTKRTSNRKISGFKDCGQSCATCPFAQSTTIHKNHKTGQKWKINSSLNCNSSNVVYKIGCKKCPDFVYVGETSKKFSTRIGQHRGYVNGKKDHPVGNHFNMRGHNLSDMIPVAIEQVLPRNDTTLRRTRERLWIRRYEAIEFGANSRV